MFGRHSDGFDLKMDHEVVAESASACVHTVNKAKKGDAPNTKKLV